MEVMENMTLEDYETLVFLSSKCNIKDKLDNFPKYVRRQAIARFLARYELFKMIVNVKGSIVECGVHHGGGLMTWAKLSAILEPYAIDRLIIGFDTFEGFPNFHKEKDNVNIIQQITFKENYDIYNELTECIKAFDNNRFISNKPKVLLVKGDARVTIPKFIEENKHIIVALLFLDFDLYEPTKIALEYFYERIPKGGVIVFDEVNNPRWPGETEAVLEHFKDFGHLELKKFYFDPDIAYVVK